MDFFNRDASREQVMPHFAQYILCKAGIGVKGYEPVLDQSFFGSNKPIIQKHFVLRVFLLNPTSISL